MSGGGIDRDGENTILSKSFKQETEFQKEKSNIPYRFCFLFI